MEIYKLNWEGIEYWDAKDIAELLEYKTPYSALLFGTKFADGKIGVRPKVSKEHILYLPYRLKKEKGLNVRPKGSYFITEEGVKELIANSQTLSAKEKQEVCDKLAIKMTIHQPIRDEVEFKARLKHCLKKINDKYGTNLTLQRQYAILNNKYRADFYIEEVNLIIEFDEGCSHSNRVEEDIIREEEIKEAIKGVSIIRVEQWKEDSGLVDILSFVYDYIYSL